MNEASALMGRMMQMPLLISSLIVHAARHHGDAEIVSRRVEGDIHRYHLARGRAALAQAGAGAGPARLRAPATASPRWPGTATGTWSSTTAARARSWSAHHQSAPAIPEQIAWIANDAEDHVLCFDLTFLPLVEKLARAAAELGAAFRADDRPRAHAGRRPRIPGLLCYEELVEAEDGAYDWPSFDENTASSMCYTSRHHRQPEGRALQPPLDAAARLSPRRCPT